MIYGGSKVSVCEIIGFVRIFWKEQHPRGQLAITSITEQIVSEILAQLCSDDWWWVTSLTIKKTVKKEFSIFFFTSCFKNSLNSLMYWLKICKAWVRSQLRWAWNWLKLNVTYEFECFEDNHSLTISTQARINTKKFIVIPKEHSLYRALKHNILQHKLDLNLIKTKQPLPIITNYHLNFRYLTASVNL